LSGFGSAGRRRAAGWRGAGRTANDDGKAPGFRGPFSIRI
jgi:hypothetical protein